MCINLKASELSRSFSHSAKVKISKINELLKVKTYHFVVSIPGLGQVHITITDFGHGHYYLTATYLSGGKPKTVEADFYTHRNAEGREVVDVIEFYYDSKDTESEFTGAGGESIIIDALNNNFE